MVFFIFSRFLRLVRNNQDSGLKLCIAALVLNFVGVFVSYVVLVFFIHLPEAPLPPQRRRGNLPACQEQEEQPHQQQMKHFAATSDFEAI